MSDKKKGKANLKVPTSEQAREYGRKGGKASGEARKKKKMLQEIVLELMQTKPTDKLAEKYVEAFGLKEDTLDNQTIMVCALYAKAIKGDIKAFEVLRDTSGQAPISKTEVTGLEGEPIKIVVNFKEPKK